MLERTFRIQLNRIYLHINSFNTNTSSTVRNEWCENCIALGLLENYEYWIYYFQKYTIFNLKGDQKPVWATT